MDQHNERHQEEDDLLRKPTDRREEDSSKERAPGRRSEEPTDQRKAAAAADERSSDEESVAASALFVHPCSLLQYLVRAFAGCLGMQDLFGGTTKRSVAAPASVDSSREGEADRDRSTGATVSRFSFSLCKAFLLCDLTS
jgi:hypothetical protein